MIIYSITVDFSIVRTTFVNFTCLGFNTIQKKTLLRDISMYLNNPEINDI